MEFENEVPPQENENEVNDGAGTVAQATAVPQSDRIKKRAKRIGRQGSKESVVVQGAGFTQAPRTWKNSRRPRNGHGRGLPKKGKHHVPFVLDHTYN